MLAAASAGRVAGTDHANTAPKRAAAPTARTNRVWFISYLLTRQRSRQGAWDTAKCDVLLAGGDGFQRIRRDRSCAARDAASQNANAAPLAWRFLAKSDDQLSMSQRLPLPEG